MKTKRRFKSDAFEAIYSSAKSLYEVGAIDKLLMQKFEASCLVDKQESNFDAGRASRE